MFAKEGKAAFHVSLFYSDFFRRIRGGCTGDGFYQHGTGVEFGKGCGFERRAEAGLDVAFEPMPGGVPGERGEGGAEDVKDGIGSGYYWVSLCSTQSTI